MDWEQAAAGKGFRLVAAPPLCALVLAEADVRTHLRRFMCGEEKEPRVEVLLPPDQVGGDRMRRVTLTMARGRNLVTGQDGVVLTCSNADLDLIALVYGVHGQAISRALGSPATRH